MKKTLLSGLAAAIIATPALAHHPLGGLPMETFTHGLLSGIGHPLLGFDHLFFVIAVGVAAIYTGYARSAPAAYILAMLVGCLMMNAGITLPLKEVVIGASLLIVGWIILSGRTLSLGAALTIFAVFGLFHGSAYGDSLAAQEAGIGGSVLIGYLLGLGILQYGVAIASGWVVKNVFKANEAMAINARLTGAIVAGMGLFLSLENAEGFILPLFGIGA